MTAVVDRISYLYTRTQSASLTIQRGSTGTHTRPLYYLANFR